jgi:uncharacterized protein YbjQ (UPF0145 family)
VSSLLAAYTPYFYLRKRNNCVGKKMKKLMQERRRCMIIPDAHKLGAEAAISVRFTTSETMAGTTELLSL